MEDSNLLRQQRLIKTQELREAGIDPYPSFNQVKHKVAEIHSRYGSQTEFPQDGEPMIQTAGRLMTIRDFGKSVFFHFQDGTGRMQGYLKKEIVGSEAFGLIKKVDLGDFLSLEGTLFRTKTGELTLLVRKWGMLAKALLPLPEKFHGLTDVEQRYRQRYLDLLVNPQARAIFETRSRLISMIRTEMNQRGFLEVETPMMQPIPGGATAKPFRTFHNALNLPLFLRIAPELYLKRLVIGGLERVYEINRNFRNEGLSIQHNPEFTMMEFYQAYATYQDLMSFTEELFALLAEELKGGLTFTYQGEYRFDASLEKNSLSWKPSWTLRGVDPQVLTNPTKALAWPESRAPRLQAGDRFGKGTMARFLSRLVEPRLASTHVYHRLSGGSVALGQKKPGRSAAHRSL